MLIFGYHINRIICDMRLTRNISFHFQSVYVGRRGHGGRVVTLSPPTSEAGDRSPYGLKWESW